MPSLTGIPYMHFSLLLLQQQKLNPLIKLIKTKFTSDVITIIPADVSISGSYLLYITSHK